MITNALNKRPAISFGLGSIKETINVGDTVTIFQNEIYNTTTFELLFNGLSKNINQFEYTPPSVGVYDLTANIITKDGKINMTSNKIILTVI